MPTTGITPQLTGGATAPEPWRLPANKGRSFIGCQPTGTGFILDADTAADLIDAGEADVVRPYLTSDEITDSPNAVPRRWIIDFGTMTLEAARQYPKSLARVRKLVKPHRDDNTSRHFARLWWQFAWPRPAMRDAISGNRYISATRVGKRLLFVWSDQNWCPGDSVVVIAATDDYTIGTLSSRAHGAWAWSRSSTMKADLRYTPSTAFETFPWPNPSPKQREEIAAAARALFALRAIIVNAEPLGLTELYNRVDDGAYTDLLKLHKTLDAAVATAYGWPKTIAQNDAELVRRLGKLNSDYAAAPGTYNPFGGD